MTPSEPFWRGRRVLLTGHTGFKGGWMATWLRLLGARVTGFALPPEAGPSLFREAGVERGITSLTGDVRDPAAVRGAVRAGDPEVVFHLAAQPLVRRGYRDPVGTFATNVMGTVHLLDALRRAPHVRAVVVVTSDKCYENREREWGCREDEPMGGLDPYSASKGCAELAAAACRASFFSGAEGRTVGVATARAGNVFGGGDWAEDRVVPDLVRALAARRPVVLRAPASVRPWQHVLEPLRGYLLLAERLWRDPDGFGGGWNFGPRDDDAVPVLELAGRFAHHWGGGEAELRPDPAAGHEAGALRLDCARAAARLGWRPVLPLDEGVAQTVRWYRAHAEDPASLPALTEAQVRAYAARAAPGDAPPRIRIVARAPAVAAAP